MQALNFSLYNAFLYMPMYLTQGKMIVFLNDKSISLVKFTPKFQASVTSEALTFFFQLETTHISMFHVDLEICWQINELVLHYLGLRAFQGPLTNNPTCKFLGRWSSHAGRV